MSVLIGEKCFIYGVTVRLNRQSKIFVRMLAWATIGDVLIMDLIHYSFTLLILFCVLYMLTLLPNYLSNANGTGGVEFLVFQCFV